jgi:hypothetical protein
VRLNLGSGPFPAEGWYNVDVSPQLHPDLVHDFARDPFPMKDVDAIYCGHVLEHLWWSDVRTALEHCLGALAVGAPLLVVGPDVLRAIECWNQGVIDWAELVTNLEHPSSGVNMLTHDGAPGDHIVPYKWEDGAEEDGYRHRWNCTEERVWWAMEQVGFRDVHPVPLDSPLLDDWPVVSRTPTQCAVLGKR